VARTHRFPSLLSLAAATGHEQRRGGQRRRTAMGLSKSKINGGSSGLDEVAKRTEGRVGKIPVTGRFHRLPKQLADDYQRSDKVLGSGYNGEVFLATDKTTGSAVAVKGFKLIGVSQSKREELESECEIFLAMDHPHVARLVDVYETPERLDLVMECMSGGELFERVIEKKRFSENDAVDACWQMLLAVNYIHSHGIVHRDIKLENFLFEKKGNNHLKLIDFGFSKIWTEHNRKMAVSCGTLAYVAPEVLAKSYDSQCDMWSVGVTIFIVLFGYMPFSGAEEKQVRDIKAGKFSYKPDVWKRVSATGQDFVRSLLVVDPKVRLTAEAALKHPWITERDTLKPETLDQSVVDALCAFGQASAFRRACMSMMAWSLSVDERAKVRDAFIELDINQTGTIKLHEFKQVLESKFHLDDNRIRAVFKSLDINNTHEIHYTEFLAAMVSTRLALHDDLLRQTFKRFDVDNSGFITADNLKAVLGETFEGNEVATIMQEADATHDGQISYDDWIQYLKGPAGENHMDAASRVIDTQLKQDGKLGGLVMRWRSSKSSSKVSVGVAGGSPLR